MEEKTQARDARVMELFEAAIGEAGGLRRLVGERRLGWLPSLLASADVLVLQEQEHRPLAEIAQLVGLSNDSVANMLAGPADRAGQCVAIPPPASASDRELAAGGLLRRVWNARGG